LKRGGDDEISQQQSKRICREYTGDFMEETRVLQLKDREESRQRHDDLQLVILTRDMTIRQRHEESQLAMQKRHDVLQLAMQKRHEESQLSMQKRDDDFQLAMQKRHDDLQLVFLTQDMIIRQRHEASQLTLTRHISSELEARFALMTFSMLQFLVNMKDDVVQAVLSPSSTLISVMQILRGEAVVRARRGDEF
jgi:hypothetical protein